MSPLRKPGLDARFQGWCDDCDQRIEIGELIHTGGSGKFVHVECPDAAAEKPTKFQGTTLEEMGF